MQRLFVDLALSEGATIGLDKNQSNYLLNVLRMDEGSQLLLFNGRDGEWRADVMRSGKKTAQLVCVSRERSQPVAPNLMFCFAPLKVGRLDYMVQKAVEMGAGILQPVLTDFTQNHRLAPDKMQTWAIEAAEQCGVLHLPKCEPAQKLTDFLDGFDGARTLIFCDEAAASNNPLADLQTMPHGPVSVLIGPEGGFSDAERAQLLQKPFVKAIGLGPRILRADTAAVAAMAIIQSVIGDW